MKQKTTKWGKLEALALLCLSILLLVLIHIFNTGDSSKIVSLNEGWHLVQGDRDILVQLPCTIQVDENNQIILYNNNLNDSVQNKILSFDDIQYNLEIKIDDEVVYQYVDNYFPKNKQMKGKLWADIELPTHIENSTLTITYSNITDSSITISAPTIGSLEKVAGSHLQNSIFSIMMMLAMLNLGIIAIIIYLYMKSKNIYERRFFDVGLFLFACSLWCMTDSGLYQIYGSNTSVGSLISFYAFMLMSIPMLHFIQDTVSLQYKKIPIFWIIVLYANAFIQGIVYLLFHIDFIYMLSITHVLLFVGVFHTSYILWKEYQKDHDRQMHICFYAFSILGLSGIVALVLYWLLGIYWYDAIFQFGILLYISLLFYGLIHKVSSDIQFRLEQTIFEKMSIIDRLTGLKNKKAFNQFMEELRILSNKYEDALLVFIDLKGLKEMNDIYGLNIGDETIIATSRCITKAVNNSSDGVIESYRIDGDEFAVIILNPKKEINSYKDALEKEIHRYNSICTDKHKMIRINYGYSYLRNPDGTIKTISDWKSDADTNLNQNREDGKS